jgi:hypothetical protein
MISVRTNRIMLGVLLAGLLTATAACAQLGETRRAPAVKSAPAAVQQPAPELVPASVPAAASAPATETRPEPTVTPRTPGAAAAAERQSNDTDDPRAVIDWLLNPSSVRGR